jgi:hypothetical protein
MTLMPPRHSEGLRAFKALIAHPLAQNFAVIVAAHSPRHQQLWRNDTAYLVKAQTVNGARRD